MLFQQIKEMVKKKKVRNGHGGLPICHSYLSLLVYNAI